MLLQTNSYIVPKEKRAEHARLMRRFRQVLNRLGCDAFEVYEQVGANWSNAQTSGRYVQIMRFRDRKHQLAVQTAERTDQAAQELIAEFCDLVNYPYQQQQGQFAVGFYSSVLPISPPNRPQRRLGGGGAPDEENPAPTPEAAGFGTPVSTPVSLTGGGSEPLTDALDEDDESNPTFGVTPDEPAADAGGAPFANDFTNADALDADAPLESAAADDEVIDVAAPAPAAHDSANEHYDDATLPTLEAESPSLADPAHADALETPPAPSETPHDLPATENGEYDLDLLGDDDVQMTDDDLARLAQELSDDPPRNNGKVGPGNAGGR